MPYILVKNINNTPLNNYYVYLYIILFSLLIFLIIKKYKSSYEYFANLKWSPYKESNTNLKHLSVQRLNNKNPICSKKCCSTQWAGNLDSDIIVDPAIENSINNSIKDTKSIPDSNLVEEPITSNLNCNNGVNDTGCVCFNQVDNKIPIKKSINALKLINQTIDPEKSINDNLSGYISDKFMNYSNF